MGEHLRNAPLPAIAVYGAQDATSPGFKLATYLERTRIKPLRWARDYALPLKKLSERRYETYTPTTILKKGWTAKHQEQIPGGILVVYETDALSQTSMAAAVAFLDRVRANVATSGRSGIPVALAIVNIGEDVTQDEKLTFSTLVKRATASAHTISTALGATDRTTLRTPAPFQQSPPAAIAVVGISDFDKDGEILSKFRNQLLDAVHDFYKSEIARIKAIKRGERRAGAIALKTRHDFKCAQYYEMRSIADKAINLYTEAYQALSSLAGYWQEEETSEYSASEIRSASEVVNFRICALRLEAGEPRQALAQLRLHLQSMTPLRDPGAEQDEYWEWLSRQHVLFAGLLSSSATSALTIAFGALDVCERERCSGFFHYTKAAHYAKKLSKPDRALDLIEKIIETNARRRHVFARREAMLLVSVAEERFRKGDEAGALRDLERSAAIFRRDHWFDLYVRVLLKTDMLFRYSKTMRNRVPYVHRDDESQYIVLYAKDGEAKQKAAEYLLLDKSNSSHSAGNTVVLIETSMIIVTVDEGGRRGLIASHFGWDLAVKCIHMSTDKDAEFGLQLVIDFSDDPAAVPANGSLLFDCIDDSVHLQNAAAVVLTLNSGALWRVAITSATPVMFSLRRSDSITRHTENHRRPGVVTKLAAQNALKNRVGKFELDIEGLPSDNMVMVGESFPLKCTINEVVDKCIIECECEASWIKIHGSTVPGQFLIEVAPSETLFVDQPTVTQLALVAFVGTYQLAKKVIDISTMWPFTIGMCKRVNGSLCAVEFESTTLPFRVIQSTLGDMMGTWSPLDRRVVVTDLKEPLKIDMVLERTLNIQKISHPWATSLSLPAIDVPSVLINNLISSTLEATPNKPWASLGEKINLTLNLVYTEVSLLDQSSLGTESSQTLENGVDLLNVKIMFEPTNGFFLSGPEVISVSLYQRQQATVSWCLYPYEVGPQRVPGVWLEVAKENNIISRRRVECVDSLCLILPESAAT